MDWLIWIFLVHGNITSMPQSYAVIWFPSCGLCWWNLFLSWSPHNFFCFWHSPYLCNIRTFVRHWHVFAVHSRCHSVTVLFSKSFIHSVWYCHFNWQSLCIVVWACLWISDKKIWLAIGVENHNGFNSSCRNFLCIFSPKRTGFIEWRKRIKNQT